MAERYHFVGIGGAGMSGLARLLLDRGIPVSGSDINDSNTLRTLEAAGARVSVGHRAENVDGATCVVYTAAVKPDNPELIEARRRGIPTMVRAELLGREMSAGIGIAITGTHGKTTTTGMAASVFLAAGADPSVLIGGDWSALGGSNARGGRGRYFIAEACEAFRSFLELRPHIALVTNIEADHLECYGSFEGLVDAFRIFMRQVAPGGYVVGCADDRRVQALLKELGGPRPVSYALDVSADYSAADVDREGARSVFSVVRRGERLGRVRLGVPGRHNVQNALGVAALALEEGLPFDAVEEGLGRFKGVERRFETLGEGRGVLVVDDYAHHPTEIRATLSAAWQSLGRPITVVFQPHLYSRTQLLLEDFAASFTDAHRVFITEIYAAREDPIEGVTGELLARRIRDCDPVKPVEYVPDRERLLKRVLQAIGPGELVMTMGAGDIREMGEELVSRLRTT